MDPGFYESTLRRLAGVAVTATVAMASSACDRPAAPPAPPPPDARAVDAAVRAVEQFLMSDRASDAVAVARRLAEQAPGLMRAHELLGRALLAESLDARTPAGRRRELVVAAADAYRDATAVDPTNAALAHAAGVACDAARLEDRAAGHYEAAHRLDPANPQYALYLGLARARQGRTAEARALLEAADRAMPGAVDPKAALADLLAREERLDEAIATLAEARAIDPGSEGLRLADARLRRRAGRPMEALELLVPLDPPVRRRPGYADEIAESYAALERWREAAEALDEAAVFAPGDADRALRAARMWMRAGDPIKATVWADAASLAGADADAVDEALRMNAP